VSLDLSQLLPTGMTLISRTVIDASGPYVIPSNASYLTIKRFGGGASGSSNTGSGNGGCGGAGGNVRWRDSVLVPVSAFGGAGATVMVTIGAGGVAPTGTGTAVSPGGDSSFGAFVAEGALGGGTASVPPAAAYNPEAADITMAPSTSTLVYLFVEGGGVSQGTPGQDSPSGSRGGGGAGGGTVGALKGGGVCTSEKSLQAIVRTSPQITPSNNLCGGNTTPGAGVGANGVGDLPGCGGDYGGGSSTGIGFNGGVPSGGGGAGSGALAGNGAHGRIIVYAYTS
jgi:hypothetical protein